MLNLTILDTGTCYASEHHVLRGGRRVRLALPVLVALVQHPQHGFLLWDAGYAPRMQTATERWPFRLYRYATPWRIRPEDAVVAQLARRGIAADAIETIIISHFHADHIAGLCDFPQARLVATAASYASIKAAHGLGALRRAFVPALLPPDFAGRFTPLPVFTGPALGALGPTHDWWGDGSLRFMALPGHARGQIGALVETTRGPVLLAADGAWLRRSYHEQRPPHPITNLLADDPKAVRTTLANLHAFAQARPDVTIIPTHSPGAWREWVKLLDRH